MFIVQQNNRIPGQPQGTGGLNPTSKTSFMVSNNNTPPPVGKRNTKRHKLAAGINVRDDHYETQPLHGGKISLKSLYKAQLEI